MLSCAMLRLIKTKTINKAEIKQILDEKLQLKLELLLWQQNKIKMN